MNKQVEKGLFFCCFVNLAQLAAKVCYTMPEMRCACMFELAKRYSEHIYYQKQDIIREMDAHLVEPVWEEILKYRSIFKTDYTILTHRFYLVYNPLMIKSLMKTQQYMMQAVLHYKNEIPQRELLPTSLQTWYFVLSTRMDTMKDAITWFTFASKQLSIPIQDDFLLFLCNDEEGTLIRLFFLMIVYQEDKKEELLTLFLMKEGYLSFLDILLDSFVSLTVEKGDVTYYFLAFLHNIWLKISNLMVLLKGNCEEDTKLMLFEELKEKYPCCRDEQLHFYIEHRRAKHYYTIRQYMDYCHVCYETARYSMEQLVRQNWHQKQKMGKKFVYKVL